MLTRAVRIPSALRFPFRTDRARLPCPFTFFLRVRLSNCISDFAFTQLHGSIESLQYRKRLILILGSFHLHLFHFCESPLYPSLFTQTNFYQIHTYLMTVALNSKMGEISISNETIHERTPFGKEMRKHFLFDASWKNLNHGSAAYSSTSTIPNPLITRIIWRLPKSHPRQTQRIPRPLRIQPRSLYPQVTS